MARLSVEQRRQAIFDNLALDGEIVIRRSTGKPASLWRMKAYKMLSVGEVDGFRYQDLEHRVKWCLRLGYLPVELDHKDRDGSNNLFSNLRDTTRAKNMLNTRQRKREEPRGVYKQPSGKFQVVLVRQGVRHYLGQFDTREAANEVALEFRRQVDGED